MIVSGQNPKIKGIRRLRHCKDDRTILEGPHLVEEACRLGLSFETSLATPDFLSGEGTRELAAHIEPPPLAVEPSLLKELTDVDAPQGILVVASLPRGGVECLPTDGDLYLWGEALQDPGNVGALSRSLEAAGGHGMALSPGSAHPNRPRALRASAGSLLRLPVARDASLEDVRRRLEARSPRVLALSARRGLPIWEADLSGPLLLAVGSEGAGLSAEARTAADLEVHVPTAAPVESLNAAVAAALVLFEVRRRRLG